MSEVLLDMAMSLDGFTKDRSGQSFFPFQQLRCTHLLNEMTQSTGAVIMDQDAFLDVQKDLSQYVFQVPIFIISTGKSESFSNAQKSKPRTTFIPEGITHAVKFARISAKNKQVVIVGGVNAAQLALEAGVVDALKVRIINLIAGKGTRLFDHLSNQLIKLETISVDGFPDRTDLLFKVVRYKYVSDEHDSRIDSAVSPP